MTNKEAIKAIKAHCYFANLKDEAKEALEQTEWITVNSPDDYPKESGDLISRQAVLEIFGYVMDYWKEHAIDVEPHEIEDALIEQYEFTAKQLSDLPPVTPQLKIGYWIDDECSICGKGTEDLISGEWYRNEEPNFCPFCGAKLVEPQESEDEE